MKQQGLRRFLALATGLVVFWFGSGHDGQQRQVTQAVAGLAVAAAVLVWYLTRPGTGGPG